MLSPRPLIVPTASFGMVLGLAGLANDWRMAAHLWGYPGWIGETIATVCCVAWLAYMVLYAVKWLAQPDRTRLEARDAVQRNFIALVPVSSMLVALMLYPHAHDVAVALFIVSMLCTLLLGVWLHGAAWMGGNSLDTVSHAHYFPTVAGNLVAAIVAGNLGLAAWGQLFLGAGLFAWLSIESEVLVRLMTAAPLPEKMRTTIGIQLAPPAVALAAYVSVTSGPPGLPGRLLLGYGLLQALLMLRLIRWVSIQSFGPGYWTFSFGSCAMALGAMKMLERDGDIALSWLAPMLFVAANLVVGALAVRSVVSLVRGSYFPK